MAVPQGMITVQEAARRLGRSIEQVRRYLREGKLKGQRIGQQWFIEETSVPLVYRPSGGQLGSLREPTAVLETPKMERAEMTREEIEAMIRRIDERGAAIRKRVSGDIRGDIRIDVVEAVREDRESH